MLAVNRTEFHIVLECLQVWDGIGDLGTTMGA